MANGFSVSIAIGATVAATLAASVSGAKGTLGQLGSVAEQLGARHKRVGDIMARALDRGRDVTALRVQYEQLGSTLASVERRSKALQASLARGVELRQERMGLGAEMLGTYLTAKAVAMPVLGAVKRTAGFEDTMRDIALSGSLTRAEETALGEAIRKSALDTAQGHEELARGVGELVNAGMSVKAAGEKAGLIGMVSTATKIDAFGVAEMMLLMSNKLEIGDAQQKEAFSRLVQGTKAGRLGMDDLAKALPTLVNDFANAGIKGQEALTQIVASLQASRESAGSTEEAVANLHNWAMNMMSDTTVSAYKNAGVDYQKSMQNLIGKGYSSYEASLEIAQTFIASRGDAFMRQWKAAGEKGDEEAQQRLMENFGMSELFDRRTIKHLIAMRQGMDQYKDVKSQMGGADAARALDDNFTKRMETANAQMAKLKGVAVDLGIKVGTALLPPITNFLEAITPMATRMGEFIGAHPGAIRAVAGFIGTILALKMGVLGAGWMLNFFVKSPLNMLGTVFNMFGGKGAMIGGLLKGPLSGSLKLVGNLVLWLGRALLMNPIGLAITAIGLAAFAIYKYWTPIKGFFIGLWGKVKEAFSGGIGSVGKLILDWSPIGLFYKAFAGVMSTFGVDMPKSFSEFGANLIGGLVDGFKAKITAAKDAIIGFGQNIKGWFTSTLGIGSPSKVFAEFGDNIGQGAAIGIGRSSGLASRASAGMASSAFDAASRQRGDGGAGADMKDAIIGFGQNIKGWFTSTLGISSPSKVFAEFGDNIGQGAAIGIGRSSDLASRASAGMASSAFDAASRQRGGGDGAGMSGGITIHFSPTITVPGGTGIKEQVSDALKLSMHELEQMMARVAARQARTAY